MTRADWGSARGERDDVRQSRTAAGGAAGRCRRVTRRGGMTILGDSHSLYYLPLASDSVSVLRTLALSRSHLKSPALRRVPPPPATEDVVPRRGLRRWLGAERKEAQDPTRVRYV